MRIKSINIPEDAHGLGLKKIELPSLSQVVLLAGKNGAGKTRLLNVLAQTTQEVLISSKRESMISRRDRLQERISSAKREIIRNENIAPSRYLRANEIASNISDFRKEISEHQERLDPILKSLAWDDVVLDAIPERKLSFVDCVPKDMNLVDFRDQNENEQNSAIFSARRLGIAGLSEGSLSYIKQQQDRWYSAENPNSLASDKDKKKYKDDYSRLEELFKKFLNVCLGRDADDNPTIDGKPIGKVLFSNGEKILLQICVQIHLQAANLNNLILFFDEPENHLHPSASIDLIETIRNAAPTCQLWIATHSVPILSYFDDETLVFVEDGEAKFSGSKPEQVLNTLLGDEERIGKLQNFTNLPDILALNRYAAQCLVPPAVVSEGKGDPQAEQIRDIIMATNTGDRKIKLLDYGAGKGRLLSNLIESNKRITDRIDYYAFDPYDDDKDKCIEIISAYYDDDKTRHFKYPSELSAEGFDGEVDLIVMCNVLHEINPKKWIRLFKKGGDVSRLLNETGNLLIVEDELIPIGEIAHEYGFIVFSTSEFRELFSITNEDDARFIITQKRGGRLKAHLIAKNLLEQITNESRKSSLETRLSNAKEQIRKIRKSGDRDFKTGRELGFWVQQLANATLALEDLG